MRLVKVDDIPSATNPGRKYKKDLKTLLLRFVASDIKYAEVVFTEDDYKSPLNARNSIYQAIREHNLPVWVYLRNDRVYLEKYD